MIVSLMKSLFYAHKQVSFIICLSLVSLATDLCGCVLQKKESNLAMTLSDAVVASSIGLVDKGTVSDSSSEQ